MEKNEYIFGLRAVIEAIEAGKELDKVLIKKDLSSDMADDLPSLQTGVCRTTDNGGLTLSARR